MSSAQQLLLTALRCDIDNLHHLATTADIVSDISQFIHVLQRERGASTIYLASQGKRFKARRATYLEHSQSAEAAMRQRLEALGQEVRSQAEARLLRRIAGVWQALDELPALRRAIDQFTISPDAATQAFNHLISGLLAIVFEAADTAVDPDITRALVAIFHLMQGKELAGQERACGAFGFTLGHFDDAHRELLNQLMAAQQRCFDTFAEFATAEALATWQQALSPKTLAGIRELRDIACQRANAPMGVSDSLGETWYELTTLRLDTIKAVEDTLNTQLTALCHLKIAEARRALEHATSTPGHPLPAPCEQLLMLAPSQSLGDLTASALHSPLSRSLIELAQAQSSRLQGLSDELENTRKALRERKLIERAKGLIMAHQGMSEEEAYRFLRKTSMDQSRSMADMAQSILDLSAMLQRKDDKRQRH
ncbi:nitrate regulatory protein [Vreelandella hamiltonii]|uniref:Nitrate regulatory protein n=1 Tax=Halomonas johnsoniae TaxID=502832 RepID=A0ABQ2WBM4_9GAMM|nr:nitrate regulatory protein [Halomonas johnsoniae]GGW46298.1 nitrate regulatory protein [Halomonas johnsoniae]